MLNKLAAALFSCFVLWNFGQLFIHNPNFSKETVIFFSKIASIGWISFASFAFLFLVFFTKNEDIFKKYKFLFLAVFVLPTILIYKNWVGLITVDFIKFPWGWQDIWSNSIWCQIFFVYYASFLAAGFYLVVDFWRKTNDEIEREKSKIIFVTGIIAVLLGSVTDVIAPLLDIKSVPNIGNIIAMIWAAGVVYIMVKYDFLRITPFVAANEIVSIIPESLFLVGPDMRIITVNKSGLNLLGYKEKEVSGLSMESIFPSEEIKKCCGKEGFKKLLEKGRFRNKQANYLTKNEKLVPVSMSASLSKNRRGGWEYIVIVARDMRKNLKIQKRLEKMNKELREKIEELEKFRKVTIGRELKMVKLKERIAELEKKVNDKSD